MPRLGPDLSKVPLDDLLREHRSLSSAYNDWAATYATELRKRCQAREVHPLAERLARAAEALLSARSHPATGTTMTELLALREAISAYRSAPAAAEPSHECPYTQPVEPFYECEKIAGHSGPHAAFARDAVDYTEWPNSATPLRDEVTRNNDVLVRVPTTDASGSDAWAHLPAGAEPSAPTPPLDPSRCEHPDRRSFVTGWKSCTFCGATRRDGEAPTPASASWSAEKGPPPGVTPDMLVGALQDAVPTVPRTDGRKARAANSGRDERPVTRTIQERVDRRFAEFVSEREDPRALDDGERLYFTLRFLIDVLDEDRAAGPKGGA